jgi:hypothetical protein
MSRFYFVKILAYADDTAVYLGSLTDIKIYKLLLRQYSLAKGGVTYFYKSEMVTCGPWRRSPLDLGGQSLQVPWSDYRQRP